MEQENKSKKGLIIFILIIVAVIIGVATALLLAKGDVKKLESVFTGGEAVKVTAKIELVGDQEITIPYQEEFQESGFTATDEKLGDITESVEVVKEEINENEYNLIYKVTDSNKNVVEAKRHVILTDEIPPVITLNGNKNVYVNTGTEYVDEGATAVDEKNGDVSGSIVVEGSVDTSKTGLYILTYKATDNSGNEAVNERYVAVSEAGKVIAQDGTQGKKGVIYLTFDDGPTQSSTPQILDILDKKGVKATFFILNFDEAGAELVKREHESGHTVAIHGYSHTYSAIYQSVDTYMNNITKLQDKIMETIGVNATITRFPGGSSNTISRHYCTKIMTTLAYEMVARGYTYFDWNVDSDDAGSAKSSDDVYKNVTSHLSKDKANVVLMHDFANNTKTIGALERIIDYGLENGYTFEVITPDTQMVTHTTNN
ncbi:MAG: polysaccharide deacetylase family protein [Clostridia bacterium]|nr:polysaccharide deacetylase family protein [Clostridia bacterium]